MKLRKFMAGLLALCLLCGAASATEPQESTQAPLIEAVATGIPESWNPLSQRTAEGERILTLTADPLYLLSADGAELSPCMAAELPQDVTETYAGTFGIPEDAKRGYAFSISLRNGACWEDGTDVKAADYLFSLETLLMEQTLTLPLANLQAFYDQAPKPGEEILSLSQAGFATLEEAREAGYELFYVDVGHFWGLDAGWVSIQDRTRLKDSAIPSGITEMYVSGAYLFDRYLKTGALYDIYQGEFLGLCSQGGQIAWEDVGLLQAGSQEFVLILETPATARGIALALKDLIPVRQSLYTGNYGTFGNYLSCGPYRIAALEGGEMRLEPNPHWSGSREIPNADRIRITS